MGWMILTGLVALPVVEIMLWIKSASLIGAGATIVVSVGAVLAGFAILRHQGLTTVLEARARLERGEMPVEAAFDGLCLSLAGLLLILPGFLTDALALLLLLPPVRALAWAWLERNGTALQTVATPRSGTPGGPARPVIIETEYEVVPPEAPPAKRVDP